MGPLTRPEARFFGPVRARPGTYGMGSGWHDPVEQAVPGPLVRHVGLHGTACSVRIARSGPVADAVASCPLNSSAPRPMGPTSQSHALAFAPARSLLPLSPDSAAIDLANRRIPSVAGPPRSSDLGFRPRCR